MAKKPLGLDKSGVQKVMRKVGLHLLRLVFLNVRKL